MRHFTLSEYRELIHLYDVCRIESLRSNEIDCFSCAFAHVRAHRSRFLPPDLRDHTGTVELLQDARSDFDQQYRRAVAFEAGNDLSEREDTGCINIRHVAHAQYAYPRGPQDVGKQAFELPSRAQKKGQ